MLARGLSSHTTPRQPHVLGVCETLAPTVPSVLSFSKGGPWQSLRKNFREEVRGQSDLEGALAHTSRVSGILNMHVGVTVTPPLLVRFLIVLLQTQGTRSFWCNMAPGANPLADAVTRQKGQLLFCYDPVPGTCSSTTHRSSSSGQTLVGPFWVQGGKVGVRRRSEGGEGTLPALGRHALGVPH